MSVYTRGEVIWLLGMDRQQAIDEDAFPQSQLANMSPDEEAGGSHGGAGDSEDVPLLVIARWTDVHRARKRARLPPELLVPLAMRAQGATEEEVAEQLSLSDSTARRRFRAGLAAVLLQLGVTDHNVDVGRSSSAPVAKRHQHTFTALCWHFGPFGRQDVHVHDCFDEDCGRVLIGQGRECDGDETTHWRETL